MLLFSRLGLPWTIIEEDRLRAVIGHIHTFTADAKVAFDTVTERIESPDPDCSGFPHNQVTAIWTQLGHSRQMQAFEACGRSLAATLEVAVRLVADSKTAAVAEMTTLAESAKFMSTTGNSFALHPSVFVRAQRISATLEMIEQYVVEDIICTGSIRLERAVNSLLCAVESALRGPLSNLFVSARESQLPIKEILDRMQIIQSYGVNLDEQYLRFTSHLATTNLWPSQKPHKYTDSRYCPPSNTRSTTWHERPCNYPESSEY